MTTIRTMRRPPPEKTSAVPPDGRRRSAPARRRTAFERPQTVEEAAWDSEGGARPR
jgi:hypothetical protein